VRCHGETAPTIPLLSVALMFCSIYFMLKGVDFIYVSVYLMFLVVVFMYYEGVSCFILE
jgi:hypothetical protein